jgi:hypothetical protein
MTYNIDTRKSNNVRFNEQQRRKTRTNAKKPNLQIIQSVFLRVQDNEESKTVSSGQFLVESGLLQSFQVESSRMESQPANNPNAETKNQPKTQRTKF